MLNKKGYAHAKKLINAGQVNKAARWSFSASDGNKLLGADGDDWANYGKWFMFIDNDEDADTKGHYKFPFGKNGEVYRKAIIAIKQRASQFDYSDVLEAATELLDLIDKEENNLDKRHIISVEEDEETVTIVYEKDTMDDNSEEAEEMDQEEMAADDEEEILEEIEEEEEEEIQEYSYSSNIIIVSGAPCSGKNTYVDKYKRTGDLVWDFDKVHSALTGSKTHEHLQSVRKYIFSMRDKFYSDLKNEKQLRVWIINSSPYKSVRKSLAKELDACLIYIQRSKDDCIKSASNERPEVWRDYINSYFEQFEEIERDENIKIIEDNKMDKRSVNVWDEKHTSEKRYFAIQSRLTQNKGKDVVIGHAAVFNTLSEDLGGFQERIEPNAFDDVLENDVRAYFNHDPNYLLGRTSAGTLRLSVDQKGLRYELDVPNTTAGRDLKENMRLGNITQSSFAFTIGKDGDSWERGEDGNDIRIINKVDRLYDVSPVSLPAYPDANDLALAKRSNFLYKEKQKQEAEKRFEKDYVKNSLLKLTINILKRKAK